MSTQDNENQRTTVRHLRIGNFLPVTDETIVWCYRGAHTPKNKHSVRTRKSDGTVRDSEWNSSTTVWIKP